MQWHNRILIGLIISLGSLFAQQQELTLAIGIPAPVNQITVNNATGTPAATTQCFYVVAIYPIGESSPAGPQCIFNATQAGTIIISWTGLTGATGYHVLQAATQTNPLSGGSCGTCRISTNQATTSFTWNLAAGGAYTPSPAQNAVSHSVIDNLTFTQARVVNNLLWQFKNGVQFLDGTILTSINTPVTSATQLVDSNGLPVVTVATIVSQVNGLLVTPAITGSSMFLTSADAGADANAGFDITSNGTGNISFFTGNHTRKHFAVLNTNGTIINNFTMTGAITTNPPLMGIGSTTDVDVGMNFQNKGIGSWSFTSPTATNQGFTFVPSVSSGSQSILFGGTAIQSPSVVNFAIQNNNALNGSQYAFWYNGVSSGQPILTLSDSGANVIPTNGINIINPGGAGSQGPTIQPITIGALNLGSSGSSNINFFTGGGLRQQLTIGDKAGTIINRILITGNTTTNPPTLAIDTTTDTNVGINITPKGNLPVSTPGIQSNGTKFTITGCTAGTTVGGATAGTFVSGTTGVCTVVITMNGVTGLVATNGWSCGVSNQTTANLIRQSASSTTTATVTGVTVASDVIIFSCQGF